jgi:hypothetical protein
VANFPGYNFTAVGGTAPYTWTASGLPPGVTLSSDGIFGGTPTQSGTFKITLTAKDSTELTGSITVTITVLKLRLLISDSSNRIPPLLDPVTVNTALPANVYFEAQGGSQSDYVWTITGTLPPGIKSGPATGCTITTCALMFTGTPTTVGQYSFSVTVTDSQQTKETVALLWIVNAAGSGPTIETSSLPLATIGSSYSTTLKATGGTGKLTWKIVGAAPDPKLTFSGSGVLAGTPSLTNDCPSGPAIYLGLQYPQPVMFAVEVTDILGLSDLQQFCLPSYYPQPAISSISPPYIVPAGNPKTITVNGTNFTRQSEVQLNWMQIATQYVSPTQLTITAQPSAQALFQFGTTGFGAGTYPLRVIEPYAGIGATTNFSIFDPVPTVTGVSAVLNNTTNQPCTVNELCQLIISGGGFTFDSQITISSGNQELYVASPQGNLPWPSFTTSSFSISLPGAYTVHVTNPSQPNGGTATATGTFQVAAN